MGIYSYGQLIENQKSIANDARQGGERSVREAREWWRSSFRRNVQRPPRFWQARIALCQILTTADKAHNIDTAINAVKVCMAWCALAMSDTYKAHSRCCRRRLAQAPISWSSQRCGIALTATTGCRCKRYLVTLS